MKNFFKRFFSKSKILFFTSVANALVLLKDWKFVYKLMTFLILFSFFLAGVVYGVFVEYWYINPKTSQLDMPRLYNFNVLVIFWSVQTNILACLYFFYALLYHNKTATNKFTNLTTQTSITIYITVTMVLFWLLVFYGVGTGLSYEFASNADRVIGITMHAITPLLTLIYLLLSLGKTQILYKKYFTRQIFWMLGYPIGYLIFINLRAKLLYDDGIRIFLFPYEFVDFYHPIFPLPVVWNNILLVGLGISFLVGINVILIVINNLIYKKTKHISKK